MSRYTDDKKRKTGETLFKRITAPLTRTRLRLNRLKSQKKAVLYNHVILQLIKIRENVNPPPPPPKKKHHLKIDSILEEAPLKCDLEASCLV